VLEEMPRQARVALAVMVVEVGEPHLAYLQQQAVLEEAELFIYTTKEIKWQHMQ
jgi:hypothetical protein